MEKTKSYRMSNVVRRFNKKQKRFLASQIVGSVYNTLISGTMITGFLLYLGIPSYWIGILMSIPMLANVVQILIDHIWDFLPHSSRVITSMVLIARLLILSIIFIPWISVLYEAVNGSYPMTHKIIMIIIIWFPAYILSAGSGIRMNYWMVSIFPAQYSSVLLAYRDRIVIALSSALLFGIGCYIDLLQGTKNELTGYMVLFLIACMVSLMDFFILKDVTYPTQLSDKREKSFINCIRVISSDKKFIKFETYIFFLNLSMNIANPYFNAYMIEQLHLKYVIIMSLNILLAVTEIIAANMWGNIGAKVSWNKILKRVSIILGVQFLVWSMVTQKTIWIIILIYFSSGMIATGLASSQFMLPYHYIEKENVFTYMSVHTTTVALGGFAGSLIGSIIIQMFKSVEIQIGGILYSSMQMNMVISGFLILIITVCVGRRI